MRGQPGSASAALLRVDGAGKIDLVAFESMKFSKVELPNAPVANPADRRNPRMQSITDLAFARRQALGRRPVERGVRLEAARDPVPVRATPTQGTSVEIFHGTHGQLETRSPVYTFRAVHDRRGSRTCWPPTPARRW